MGEQVKKNTGGRPVKTLKRDIIIRVRLDKQEEFILRQKAGAAGQTLSHYIRQEAITGKVLARLTADERDKIRKLVGMCTNLNQLAKEARKAGMIHTALTFETYRQFFDDILKPTRRDQ